MVCVGTISLNEFQWQIRCENWILDC
jgi:hypothetical protein